MKPDLTLELSMTSSGDHLLTYLLTQTVIIITT